MSFCLSVSQYVCTSLCVGGSGFNLLKTNCSNCYALPYWSNLPFLISDIRALWRSALSARVEWIRSLLSCVVYACVSVCQCVCMCLCVDTSVRTELDTMIDQVLNVLPHIPADVIRQDLGTYCLSHCLYFLLYTDSKKYIHTHPFIMYWSYKKLQLDIQTLKVTKKRLK